MDWKKLCNCKGLHFAVDSEGFFSREEPTFEQNAWLK